MNGKISGLLRRIEELESAADSVNDEGIDAFMESVSNEELERQLAYCTAVAAIETSEPFPAIDMKSLTRTELHRSLKPEIERMRAREAKTLEALEAGKPLTREQALTIALPLIEAAGLPMDGFTAWIDSDSGINYLRRLNGAPELHYYELMRMRELGIKPPVIESTAKEQSA